MSILPEVELARKSETDGHTYSDDTIYCVFASTKLKILFALISTSLSFNQIKFAFFILYFDFFLVLL